MEILPFEPENLKEVKEIDRECFPKREVYFESYLLFLWRKFPRGFLVAKEGKEILGYGICQKKGKQGVVFSIAVRKKHRGRGVGKEILKNLIEILKNSGCKEIILHVKENNQKAISFYERFGFKIRKKIEKYYSNGESAYLMTFKFSL
jgi:ribosomal-protein-alanine N-acetyltransferase